MNPRNCPSSPAQSPETQQASAGTPPAFGPKDWLFIGALLAAVVLVYQPAWRGGILWDDDFHITRPELCSWHGLYRIWFDVGATLQYYPLLHSAFWIEHRLWGDDTLGYHLVNVLLHAADAVMVVLILRRLKIPGAYLAAALFALHPIQAESVAWMTEQKNTLSGLFYLGALSAYLRFDQSRKGSLYCGALGLFILGILTKTIIATLPGALLVIFWWQRGRLSWRSDVLPLLPFFILGAGGGMITAWWELQINKCVGPEFALSFVERCLIAGRTVWFLLWKLFWPTQLTFIYPRWQIDAGTWWQYAFPLGAAALLAVLWVVRRWTRAPLAALLFFGGTLFPMLGFFNLYTFRYSFVANHYVYLASLGIIALAAAGAAVALKRWGLWERPPAYASCLAVLGILASLTWQQSRMYADAEALYRTTIAENPGCWMAYTNLGIVLDRQERTDEAIDTYRAVLELKPDDAYACNNLGVALDRRGRPDEAMTYYQEALKIQPDYAEAHNNLGGSLAAKGRVEEAIAHYRQALEAQPNYAEAHYNLGLAFARQGRVDEVLTEFQRAVEIKPEHAQAQNNLGLALAERGRLDEAIAHFQQALETNPDHAGARNNLGVALSEREGMLRAVAQRRQSLLSRPDDLALLNDLAWQLATNPNASIRDGVEALDLAQRAVQLSEGREPAILDTLAATQAEAGQFAEAAETARKAGELAVQQNKPPLAESIKAKIPLYEAGTPFARTREKAPGGP